MLVLVCCRTGAEQIFQTLIHVTTHVYPARKFREQIECGIGNYGIIFKD